MSKPDTVLKAPSKPATTGRALDGIAAMRTVYGRDNPEVEAAHSVEREAEAFCAMVRAQLKQRRKALGWDQARAAKELNISQSAISKIEGGHGDIGLKTVFRYASALERQPLVVLAPLPQEIATVLCRPNVVYAPSARPTTRHGEAHIESKEFLTSLVGALAGIAAHDF